MEKKVRNYVVLSVVMFSLAQCVSPVYADGKADEVSRDSGFYTSISGGWQQRSKTWELGGDQYTSWKGNYEANLAVGYQFCRYFRSDLEITYLESDANRNKAGIPGALETDADGTAKFKAATLNGYLQYPVEGTKLTPFIGGGVGLWRAELSSLSSTELARLGNEIWGKPLVLSDDSATLIGWQVSAGVLYTLTKHLDLLVEYRYYQGHRYALNFPDYDISVAVPEPVFNMYQVGVIYRF